MQRSHGTFYILRIRAQSLLDDSYLRVLIDALRKRLLHKVPISIDRYTGEDGTENRSDATCDANRHREIDGQSGLLESKDAPVLQQDRDLCRSQSDVIRNDSKVKVLQLLLYTTAPASVTYL